MKGLSLFLFSIIIFLSSLNCHSSGEITINEIKDSCYAIMSSDNKDTLKLDRQLEIIENTFSDTTNLGFAILLPGYTGKFNYLRFGDSIIDPKESSGLYSIPTNTICINFKKGTKGKLVIKYSLY